MPIVPFEDCTLEAQAIIRMAYAGFSMFVLVLLMILMIYLYQKVRKFLPELVVFLFSIVIGMLSISSLGIPYTPWIQIFFILIQGVFFYLAVERGDRF